jgi:hypothetical protein
MINSFLEGGKATMIVKDLILRQILRPDRIEQFFTYIDGIPPIGLVIKRSAPHEMVSMP